MRFCINPSCSTGSHQNGWDPGNAYYFA